MGRTARSQIVLVALAALASACNTGGAFGREVHQQVDCSQPNCGWQAQLGAVERTGSWHPKEFAVSLVGAPARITRTVRVTSNRGCLHFDYVGDIEASTETRLLLDFNDDGRDDAESVLPASHWTRQTLQVHAPADYNKLRISLFKTGAGTAKLTLFSMYDSDDCGGLPAIKLQNGAACVLDATCSSERCLQGLCSACGVGGCVEGEACRDSSECLDGACAAQVCRRCAKEGTCGAGEGCSAPEQCATRSCIAGSVPSMTKLPALDATCGECDDPSDCGGKACVLGRCASCAVDPDCGSGLACRWLDSFDALQRGCVPRVTSPLPRGALCESDGECEGSLPCSASDGRARRCGSSCASEAGCGAGQLCVAPGARKASNTPERFAIMPRWDELAGRVATCWARTEYGQACQLHQQCGRDGPFQESGCCEGVCGSSFDFASGMCVHYTGTL